MALLTIRATAAALGQLGLTGRHGRRGRGRREDYAQHDREQTVRCHPPTCPRTRCRSSLVTRPTGPLSLFHCGRVPPRKREGGWVRELREGRGGTDRWGDHFTNRVMVVINSAILASPSRLRMASLTQVLMWLFMICKEAASSAFRAAVICWMMSMQ